MKKIMAYLASPYTSKDPFLEQERKHTINKIGAILNKQGHCIFAPITTSATFSQYDPEIKGSYEHWKDIDRCAIEHCDELWVCTLEGWKESIGVTDEIYWARISGKIVRYLDPVTLEFTYAP